MLWDAIKAAGLLFVAAIAQVSIVANIDILHATPDLALVSLVAVALLRGPVYGAVCGFWVGFLLDSARLDVLGQTALLLTLAGYWIGRYGETSTGRERTRPPFLATTVVTVVYALGNLMLRFMLGQAAPARLVLVDSLLQQVVLNLLLLIPVYALLRRVLRPDAPLADRAREVRLLG